MVKPVLKWPGAKWRIADWIVAQMPPHVTYLEPFFGSGAVFFRKPPARLETVNDLDGAVVALFRTIRERPAELAAAVELTPWAREEPTASIGHRDEGDEVEKARRLLVWSWQQIGRRIDSDAVNGWRWTKDATSDPVLAWRGLPDRVLAAVARLRRAQIECRPALDVIRAHRSREVLIYADPPYVHSTRSRDHYRNEMTNGDHDALIGALLDHPGPVLLSGYDHPLYASLGDAGWRRESRRARAESTGEREEILWFNEAAAAAQDGRLDL